MSAGWVSTGAPSDSSRDLPAGSARAGMVAGFSRSAGRCPPLVLTGRIWPRRFGSVAHSLAPFGIADYEESKYGSERHQLARGLENESSCVRRTREVVVKDVPDAKIEHPTDVLVKITTTNICGSDLHMYEGRTDLEPGMVLGHENMGIVAEVGSAVVKLSPGDRVCVPFNIGCGFCRNCEEGLTAFCLTAHPDPKMAGAAYGFAGMGPFWGGQAEYLRVPFGDFNCLRLPEDAQEKEADYVMLADIFPTGWHCTPSGRHAAR